MILLTLTTPKFPMKDPDHIQHKDEVYFYFVFFYFPKK